MNVGQNVYNPDDLPGVAQLSQQRVFLSHRSQDKPVVRAIATMLAALDVHYWLDEQDQDLQRANALGMLGDKAVVHAIERGVRHATVTLGLISSRTEGSWWVPYELGYSRAADKPVSFLVINSPEKMTRLPGYARIAAAYWSIDELARWGSTLAGQDLHSSLAHLSEAQVHDLAKYVPLDPPQPDFWTLCKEALTTIERLENPVTHSVLALTSERFDWLPTPGGPVREIAYNLLAPLAYIRLGLPIDRSVRELADKVYLVPTQHYEIARYDPQLIYHPEISDWKVMRYRTPSQTWLQGLRRDQLDERIIRFLITRNRRGEFRLATKEEFKAEFDRVLSSSNEQSRRALGVLVNPLFGFTPQLRPVYWRILKIQHGLYSAILDSSTGNYEV